MDVTGEGSDVCDVAHVLLTIEDCLIEVRD